MVHIDVSISQSVDEIAGLESCDVGYHVGQEGITGDIERHPKADIPRSLVQLTGEFVITHVELNKSMTRGKRHLIEVTGVPRGHDDASVVWIILDLVNDTS